ncbi:S24 family peptidase [Oscillibacter sp.]|uniref:S24 family peptidase n=1 Tax=Oscillibacter sp. TaxID=1945593 RepID=UPI00339742A0
MATDKMRYTISLSDEELDIVNKFRFESGINSQSKAIIELMKEGIGTLGISQGKQKNASPYSGEALKLAKDYDVLDKWGRVQVRNVADNELSRIEDEAAFKENSVIPDEPKVINLYLEPAAAGIATPLVGQDYEPYELGPGDPPGAAFAIRIQGDSMEPYFPDGSTAFVNHDALADGDIGVFCVDGGTVCKQYHYDRVLGITYLFSLNRERADCDVVITRDSNQSLVCQGRVMTRKHFPLPEL